MESPPRIGFRRNIKRAWLDAAAAFCLETDDPAEIRRRLDPIVAQEIASTENRRMALDILLNVWTKTAQSAPRLRATAVERVRTAETTTDLLWLHYGLTLLAYPFFRETVAAVGRLTRHEEAVTPKLIKQRLIASRGQLGSLEKAVERVVFSLRDWGMLVSAERPSAYCSTAPLVTADPDGETWLLACALHAHPAEELPLADLLTLPELFPFRLTVAADQLRSAPFLAVHRQGSGWDTVRLAQPS